VLIHKLQEEEEMGKATRISRTVAVYQDRSNAMTAILHLTLAVILLLPSVFVGCGDRLTTEQPNVRMSDEELAANQSSRDAEKSERIQSFGEERPFFRSELPNGVAVQVSEACIIGDSIHIRYRYESASGRQLHRVMKIHVSLLGMTLYNETASLLGGHEFVVRDLEDVELRVWTDDDTFTVSASVLSDSSLTLSASDGLSATSVSFDCTQEFYDAALLSEEYAGKLKEFDLSYYELSLLNSIETWAGAMEQYSSFTIENQDLETAEYLMADEGFLTHVFSEFGADLTGPILDINDLCAAAGIGSFICGFLWWCAPCWIPCVPTVGIALACAIAELFS
jgi:hypothetical protein